MILDNVQIVSRMLESILDDSNSSSSAKPGKSEEKQKYEKYMRFWRLMEIIAEKGSVSRSDLVKKIFKDHPSELDMLHAANFIRYKFPSAFLPPPAVKVADSLKSKSIIGEVFIRSFIVYL